MNTVKKIDTSKWSNLARKGLVLCNQQALAYGGCVSKNIAVLEQDTCNKEFAEFYNCMKGAIDKRRGR